MFCFFGSNNNNNKDTNLQQNQHVFVLTDEKSDHTFAICQELNCGKKALCLLSRWPLFQMLSELLNTFCQVYYDSITARCPGTFVTFAEFLIKKTPLPPPGAKLSLSINVKSKPAGQREDDIALAIKKSKIETMRKTLLKTNEDNSENDDNDDSRETHEDDTA